MAEEQEKAALLPLEEHQVEFHGDTVVAVKVRVGEQERIYVPLKPITDAIGLDWSAQYRRVQRDPILSEEAELIAVTAMNPNPSGGRPDTLCLPVDLLNGWLFGINASRVKEELREAVLRYQRECYRALHEYFQGSRLPEERLDDAMIRAMRDNALQQAQLWEAILEEKQRLRVTEELVQEHDDHLMAHDRHLWQHDQALAETLEELEQLRRRQNQIVARLSDVRRLLPVPSEAISPAQKSAIKELVDDIVAAAQERGIRLGQGRNDYPAVWGAFKQRFDLAKYDELTVGQYEEAVGWLKGWLDRVRGAGSGERNGSWSGERGA
ncbi:MAG: ORF6C domain-containing protein [Chloroflexota bacterium]|nr:ORF6C domain-containing protein [Chloroflexota bacterium]